MYHETKYDHRQAHANEGSDAPHHQSSDSLNSKLLLSTDVKSLYAVTRDSLGNTTPTVRTLPSGNSLKATAAGVEARTCEPNTWEAEAGGVSPAIWRGSKNKKKKHIVNFKASIN